MSDSGPPQPSAGPLAPVARRERILALDALRGFALLGILFVNARHMALPIGVDLQTAPLPESSALDRGVWLAVRTLCEMRFVTLFSLMFGVGYAIQRARAERRGEDHQALWLRRMAVLMGFGLLHAFGLWYGDILFTYALLGPILLLARRTEAGPLLKVGVGLWLLGAGVLIALNVLASLSPPLTPSAAPDGLRGAQAIAGYEDPEDPRWQAAEVAAYAGGPWVEVMMFHLLTLLVFAFFIPIAAPWVLGCFVLGVALQRHGVFESARLQSRLLRVGLPVGLACAALEGAIVLAGGWGQTAGWLPALARAALHSLGALPLALGYMGLICVLGRRAPGLVRPLATAGRMALTVYLGETLLTTACTHWWGLGWFGQLGHAQLAALALAVYGTLVVFAMAWDRVFAVGPLEAIWRRLSYGRWPPLRRSAA